MADLRKSRKALRNSLLPSFCVLQVRLAEHVSTKHRVAIKIMDRKLLQQKDLDGKGATVQRLVSRRYLRRLRRHHMSLFRFLYKEVVGKYEG
jgi:hypothetical protein